MGSYAVSRGQSEMMLCPEGIRLKERRDRLFLTFMEAVNATPSKSAGSREKSEQEKFGAKLHFDLANKILHNHSQVCRICSPSLPA